MGRAYPRRNVRTSGPKKSDATLLYKCSKCGAEITRVITLPRGKKYASSLSPQTTQPSHCPHCSETHPNTCACSGCKALRERAQ